MGERVEVKGLGEVVVELRGLLITSTRLLVADSRVISAELRSPAPIFKEKKKAPRKCGLKIQIPRSLFFS